MIDIYAESKSTKARLWHLARKGGDVLPDDGIGARQIAGLCGAMSAALIAKASPKGLREWLSLAGPYTFTPLTGDRLLPLNRYYKPLGLGSAQWVEYENFAALAVPTGRLFLEYAAPVYPERTDGHCREYLYDDGNSPWRDLACLLDYLTRLVGLVALRP